MFATVTRQPERSDRLAAQDALRQHVGGHAGTHVYKKKNYLLVVPLISNSLTWLACQLPLMYQFISFPVALYQRLASIPLRST